MTKEIIIVNVCEIQHISRFTDIFSSHLQHLYTALDLNDSSQDCVRERDYPLYELAYTLCQCGCQSSVVNHVVRETVQSSY